MLKRSLIAISFGLLVAVVPGAISTCQAGFLVIADTPNLSGAATATTGTAGGYDGLTQVVTFSERIVGAANPTLSDFHVVNTLHPSPNSGSTAVTGKLTTSGAAITGAPANVTLNAGESANLNLTLDASSVGDHTGLLKLHRGLTGVGVTVFNVPSGPDAGTYIDKDDTLQLQVKVLDHSHASFNGQSGQTSLTLDFGTIQTGYSAVLPFDVFNLVTTPLFTAGLDLLSVSGTGDTSMFTDTLSPFSNLFAGNSQNYFATFSPTAEGVFIATYVLRMSDQNLPGATTQELFLTLTGRSAIDGDATQVPEPSSIVLALTGILAVSAAGMQRRTGLYPSYGKSGESS